MSQVLLLGGTGYVGQAFAAELGKRDIAFEAPSRKQWDYTRFDLLYEFLEKARPDFVVNAAGYTGKPNVDACELHRADTLQGNTLYPAAVAHACSAMDIPYGHVSSGCIYSGAKFIENGVVCVERDLTKASLQPLLDGNSDTIRGFTELDEPNFTFRNPPCSFYSGTKALAEEAIRNIGQNYIWRLRIPFDQFDNPRNYLSKLQNYPKVYQNVNSLSHRRDFVSACLDLWQLKAPFGIYNVTNPGHVSTRQVVEMLEQILKPVRSFEFWQDDGEFYKIAAKTPRSNCIMDATKLLSAGVKMRPVEEALHDSLKQWTKQ